MAGKQATLDSSFSFADIEEEELNKTKTSDKETSDDKKAEEKIEDDNIKFDSLENDGEEDLFDESNSAFVLLETDDFVMTDKGVIPKSSLKQDNSQQKKANPNTDEKILGKFNSVDDLAKSYAELEKKLGSNSEAISKLREVEPVLPMFEAMINDENFLEMAEKYFTDPEEQRKALMKSLDLEDGYVFDLDTALSDPKSKDAQILQKLTQRQAAPQKQQTSKNQQSSNNPISNEDKAEFIKKHGIEEKDFDAMLEQAKTYKITLDDIYYLINREKIIENAKKEASKSFREQSTIASTIGRSKSQGSSVIGKTAEDAFMDFIKSGSQSSIFG